MGLESFDSDDQLFENERRQIHHRNGKQEQAKHEQNVKPNCRQELQGL